MKRTCHFIISINRDKTESKNKSYRFMLWINEYVNIFDFPSEGIDSQDTHKIEKFRTAKISSDSKT